NALTAAMRAQFCALVEEADADDATRAVIVTAVDPVFSAGVDFKEVAAGSGSAAAANPGVTLRAARTPVVCAVNGACVTGALDIAPTGAVGDVLDLYRQGDGLSLADALALEAAHAATQRVDPTAFGAAGAAAAARHHS